MSKNAVGCCPMAQSLFFYPKIYIMENNLKNTGTRDENRISLEKDEDVNFWTAKFGIPAEGLQSAIKASGSDL